MAIRAEKFLKSYRFTLTVGDREIGVSSIRYCSASRAVEVRLAVPEVGPPRSELLRAAQRVVVNTVSDAGEPTPFYEISYEGVDVFPGEFDALEEQYAVEVAVLRGLCAVRRLR